MPGETVWGRFTITAQSRELHADRYFSHSQALSPRVIIGTDVVGEDSKKTVRFFPDCYINSGIILSFYSGYYVEAVASKHSPDAIHGFGNLEDNCTLCNLPFSPQFSFQCLKESIVGLIRSRT